MKNEVVIETVDFLIRNYNDTGVDYMVNAYAIDTDDSDQYGIKVWNTSTGELHAEYHADSSGNVMGDEAPALEDDVTMLAHTILFIRREHGIIRGF